MSLIEMLHKKIENFLSSKNMTQKFIIYPCSDCGKEYTIRLNLSGGVKLTLHFNNYDELEQRLDQIEFN